MKCKIKTEICFRFLPLIYYIIILYHSLNSNFKMQPFLLRTRQEQSLTSKSTLSTLFDTLLHPFAIATGKVFELTN